MILRRRLLASLALFCALNACVSNPEQWEARQHARELPAVFVTSTLDRIQRMCPNTANAVGCAVRDYGAHVCYVYITADSPPWVVSHELLHCAGYDHA
jgi:hypothetical protein